MVLSLTGLVHQIELSVTDITINWASHAFQTCCDQLNQSCLAEL